VVLTVRSLVIQSAFNTGDGGGILNFGQLTLDHVTLRNNSGWGGGGVRNELGATLTALDTTITANQSPSGQGGGLYNLGQATVQRTVVSGNLSNGAGGINNQGILTLVDSRVTGNDGLGVVGGGMMNGGTATLVRSTVDGNQSAFDGGGIHNTGSLSALGSTISGNRSHVGGGGGLANAAGGTAFLARVTFRSNVATSPLHGGSLSKEFGTSTTLEGTILSDGGCMGAVRSPRSGTTSTKAPRVDWPGRAISRTWAVRGWAPSSTTAVRRPPMPCSTTARPSTPGGRRARPRPWTSAASPVRRRALATSAPSNGWT
jgi:hypothetical protein